MQVSTEAREKERLYEETRARLMTEVQRYREMAVSKEKDLIAEREARVAAEASVAKLRDDLESAQQDAAAELEEVQRATKVQLRQFESQARAGEPPALLARPTWCLRVPFLSRHQVESLRGELQAAQAARDQFAAQAEDLSQQLKRAVSQGDQRFHELQAMFQEATGKAQAAARTVQEREAVVGQLQEEIKALKDQLTQLSSSAAAAAPAKPARKPRATKAAKAAEDDSEAAEGDKPTAAEKPKRTRAKKSVPAEEPAADAASDPVPVAPSANGGDDVEEDDEDMLVAKKKTRVRSKKLSGDGA